MKHYTKMIVTVLALFAVTPVMATNILVNPGFETGVLAPWFQGRDFSAAGPWAATNSDARTGSWSAFVGGNREIRQDFAAVDVADVNVLSLWLKMPGGPPAISFVTTFYDDFTENGAIFNIAADWTFVDFTSLLVAGKNLIGIGVFGCDGCGGEQLTFLDDAVVDVNVVPEPITLALMGLGLAGIAFTRRRRLN
jgi:PEP-CTERM motif